MKPLKATETWTTSDTTSSADESTISYREISFIGQLALLIGNAEIALLKLKLKLELN